MNVFPQLTTGAAALYPIRRSRRRRSVVNALADGGSVVYGDPDTATTPWSLEATGLSQAEWEAIDTLFATVSGRLDTFTFLEPAGNLLLQSEEMDAPEWNAGPLVTVTTGVSDPRGGTGAVRLECTPPVEEEFGQILLVPGTFRYALSVWARMHVSTTLTLFASAAGGEVERTFALTSEWQRVVLPVDLGLETESVTFGVRLAAASDVELFGMQVDAQPGAGGYQRTGAKAGVHSHARFAEDALSGRVRGTDVFDAVIRIVSKGN